LQGACCGRQHEVVLEPRNQLQLVRLDALVLRRRAAQHGTCPYLLPRLALSVLRR
jgi:hypothetical protein